MNSELKQILDNLPEGILLYNQNEEKVTMINKEFQRLFNVSEDIN